MSHLYRLVYSSVRKPSCDEAEIQKILDACKRKNPGRNVTGILLHSDNRFIQYIEGEKEQVLDLYELIKKDDRHTSVNQRDFAPITERVFPSWEMGYKDMNNKLSFDTNALASHKAKFEELFSSDLNFSNKGVRTLQIFFDITSA